MLNLIISNSQSFEAGTVNGFANYRAEGSIVDALKELGFVNHSFYNDQTGHINYSNMWYKNDLYITVGKEYWFAIRQVGDDFVPVS